MLVQSMHEESKIVYLTTSDPISTSISTGPTRIRTNLRTTRIKTQQNNPKIRIRQN